MEQRTAEWHEVRLGKFTASEIHKLMGIKGLGETGKGYCFEKAIELTHGKLEENYQSFDMIQGVELEPLAFAKIKQLKALEFIDVVNCGAFTMEDISASPDGLVGNHAVLEIKCPNYKTFFELVATNEIDKKYFYQMQMQMMLTDREYAVFFNYYVHEGTEFYHELIVKRDDTTIELMTERIEQAIVIRDMYAKNILLNRQW